MSNIWFYGCSAILGFAISLLWWRGTKLKVSKMITAVFIPIVYAGIGILIIYSVGDKEINGIKDILVYFDVSQFIPGPLAFRPILPVVFFISTTFFTLLFDWLWGLKNMAQPVAGGDATR